MANTSKKISYSQFVLVFTMLFTALLLSVHAHAAAMEIPTPVIKEAFHGSPIMHPDGSYHDGLHIQLERPDDSYALQYEVLYGVGSSPDTQTNVIASTTSYSYGDGLTLFLDTELTTGKTYYFMVRRCLGSLKSEWSDVYSYTYKKVETPTITSVTTGYKQDYSNSYSYHPYFTVRWEPVANAEEYVIGLYRYNTGNGSYTQLDYQNGIYSTSYKLMEDYFRDSDIGPNETLYIRVMAYSETNHSYSAAPELYEITAPDVPVTEIDYTGKRTITLSAGDSCNVGFRGDSANAGDLILRPYNATSRTLLYTSSDPDVATVRFNSGRYSCTVTAVAPGRTVITGSSPHSDAFYTFEVIVVPKEETPPGEEPKTTGSGSCGESASWVLDENGVLTISGIGAITSSGWSSLGQYVKRIEIEEGITEIGEYAFSSCYRVTSVVLPESLEQIHKYILQTDELAEIFIPKNVCAIHPLALSPGCTKLSQINVSPDNSYYHSVDGVLFETATHTLLRYPASKQGATYSIPEGTRIIADWAFGSCNYLYHCIMPDSVFLVAQNAFASSSLRTLRLSAGLEILSRLAIQNCDDLSYIYIPRSMTFIESQAFYGCDGQFNVDYEGTKEDWDKIVIEGSGNEALVNAQISYSATHAHTGGIATCTSKAVCVICNEEYGGYWHLLEKHSQKASTCIQHGWDTYVACTKCSYSTYKERPLSPTHTIEKHGAYPAACEVEGNITYYKCADCKQYFSDAEGNEKISYADTVIAVLGHSYSMSTGKCANCGNMKPGYCGENLTWELDANGVLTINGTGEMWPTPPWDSSAVEEVVLNYGVTSIKAVFSNCVNLKRISIPNSVTSIGNKAFYGCSGLIDVTIPGSVITIGEYAFRGCSALTNITIPSGVTTIGKCAFQGTGIKQLTIPNSVESMAQHALYGCQALEELTLPFAGGSRTNNLILGYLFDSYTSGYTDPSSGAILYKTTYSVPTSLKKVTLTDVTTIPASVFDNCSNIEAIVLPSGLVEISPTAFDECTSLADVYFPGTNLEWAALFQGELSATVHFISVIAKSMTLDETELSLFQGDSVTLTPVFDPSNTTNQTVSWSSSNPLVATVENGVVLAKNAGTVIITAVAAEGGHTATCTVTVKAEYLINDITVRDSNGTVLSSIPADLCLATVSITNLASEGNTLVFLAAYTEQGQYQGMLWVSVEELPVGATIKVTLPIDNASGNISNLKAFTVKSFSNPVPVGNTVSFLP